MPNSLPNSLSAPLLTLGQSLAGEFSNADQAKAEPTWYVPLTVWQRPTALFGHDSITLFLEQANVTVGQAPYRQRILRLSQPASDRSELRGQYYALKRPQQYQGGGQHPERLASLSSDDVERLPNCWLRIRGDRSGKHLDTPLFQARPESPCSFVYQGKTICIALGFDVVLDEVGKVTLLSYEKGLDPETGRGLWGALMGPWQFVKQRPLDLPT